MAGGRRILVVDNDPEWLDLIALDLRLEGHDIVASASSGEEALALCASFVPDVLVVDQRMPPGLSGIDVAQRVRKSLPEVQIVVFSNYEDPALARTVAGLGARFVLKTNMRALREAVLEPQT